MTTSDGTHFPRFFCNIDNTCLELYQHFDRAIDKFVPTRTRHRQNSPPWINFKSSHLLKKMQTQKRLLAAKPTIYRRNKIVELENLVSKHVKKTEFITRAHYQLFNTRDTGRIFKHLKCLKKTASLPLSMHFRSESTQSAFRRAEMFNEYFHSVFAPKVDYNLNNIPVSNVSLTNFSISKAKLRSTISDVDVSKTRGPNGYPRSFFVNSGEGMIHALHLLLKNIKRFRKIPKCWKRTVVSPIHKKGEKFLVENYRPISLLEIDSKILEKCMYSPLYEHFETSLSSRQHGFVCQKSTITNMLAFLQAVYKALDKDQHSDVVAFNTDFSKAFDKVSHYLLLCKVARLAVNGCLLERLLHYLSDRKQIVRVDNVTSRPKDVTSGVPQRSLLGPLLFCIFMNDLPEALAFSDSYFFADDLKFLSVNLTELQVQTDLQSLEIWVNKNRMALATDKCAKLTFRGKDIIFKLFGEPLKTEANVRDLGITLTSDLTWNMHISKKVAKANGVLYLLRRNVSQSVGARIKLGLYKSLVLPILLYGIQCIQLSKASMIILEKLQKRAVKWICGTRKYGQQLRFLNILPLPMRIQILNLLTLSNFRTNFCTSNPTTVTLLQSQTAPSRSKEVFKLPITRTEKSRNEFVFRTSRLANRVNQHANFEEPVGLKRRLTRLF